MMTPSAPVAGTNSQLTSHALGSVLRLGWEYAQNAMVVADVETGIMVECNPALEELTGRNRQEIIGMRFTELHPEAERAPSQVAFREAMARKDVFEGFHIQCKDGRLVPVAITSSKPFEADGRQVSIGIFQDVSLLKEREHRLTTQSWALSAYAEAALALARADSSAGLMQAICEAITRDAVFVLAWVGFAGKSKDKPIKMAGAAGTSVAFLDGLELSWDAGRKSGQGPSGHAIRTNAKQILEDTETVESFRPWRERARAAGICSLVTIPFRVNHHQRCVLVVYSSEPSGFGPVVIEAFTHLAEELGRGLHALEREERLNAERLEREKAQKELAVALAAVVGSITTAFEMRDPYTTGHQERVAEIACAIAKDFGWDEDRTQAMRVACLVHDIGKISVPSALLTKTTPLTPAELALMKQHPETGYRILKDVPFPYPIAEVIRQHHEQMDGSGYPRGLKGDQILFGSRILAVADVVEAMASNRPYRPGLGLDAALEEIEKQAGTRLDAEVVRACVALFREKGFVLPGLSQS
jgi:PAS domain S-box-containing protein/putative nucleotidyltransferase with HDIG domain